VAYVAMHPTSRWQERLASVAAQARGTGVAVHGQGAGVAVHGQGGAAGSGRSFARHSIKGLLWCAAAAVGKECSMHGGTLSRTAAAGAPHTQQQRAHCCLSCRHG
jgi:hypothetical protein